MLVGYVMKPKEGHGYLETATQFASESCAGSFDDVDSVDAHVYHINPEDNKMNIAYPIELFGRDASITCSFFNLGIGNNQGRLASTE